MQEQDSTITAAKFDSEEILHMETQKVKSLLALMIFIG